MLKNSSLFAQLALEQRLHLLGFLLTPCLLLLHTGILLLRCRKHLHNLSPYPRSLSCLLLLFTGTVAHDDGQ